MKKRPADYDSDEFDVDEPEEFEESGSDWEPDDEVEFVLSFSVYNNYYDTS